jgi:hypothetical protein
MTFSMATLWITIVSIEMFNKMTVNMTALFILCLTTLIETTISKTILSVMALIIMALSMAKK